MSVFISRPYTTSAAARQVTISGCLQMLLSAVQVLQAKCASAWHATGASNERCPPLSASTASNAASLAHIQSDRQHLQENARWKRIPVSQGVGPTSRTFQPGFRHEMHAPPDLRNIIRTSGIIHRCHARCTPCNCEPTFSFSQSVAAAPLLNRL